MAAPEGDELENNKILLYNRMTEDGKLVSPIDLSLDDALKLKLEKLKWFNISDPPVKMKLSNSGETLILSAKWAAQRPYLSGGPLTGNYVFSQIHFHWGSDEHEGSEHTVRGVSYPMEMHVVFYKTRYLTQEAALKQDDGIIIVVYLVKLQQKTTEGLQWIVQHLDNIVQPQTSTPVALSPLSSVLVPFSMDYLVYWGCLQTVRCSHTMMWIVSRAALGITAEDLNRFRSLLNSRKEPMNKNFRGTNSLQGRFTFHVNPSSDIQQFLLPGVVEPPGKVVVVGYSQMPPLDSAVAKEIFSKGDGTKDFLDKKLSEVGDISYKTEKPFTVCEGEKRTLPKNTTNGSEDLNSVQAEASRSKNASSIMRAERIRQNNMQKISNRRELEKHRREVSKENDENKANAVIGKQEKINETKPECYYSDNIDCLHLKQSPTPNVCSNEKVKSNYRSKLPVRTGGKPLQSSIAHYFQKRPDSAPGNSPRRPSSPPALKPLEETRRVSVATTIPRPLGRNAGRLDGSYDVKVTSPAPVNIQPRKRPLSSPNKLKLTNFS